MCSIRVVYGSVFDVYQVVLKGVVIAEYWVRIESEMTIKEVASEHRRAAVMEDRYGKVSKTGE